MDHRHAYTQQNLSELEPTINGPFTPDLATPLSKFGSFIREQGWKDELSAALIGSCTNSSYEDMTSVADLARQATKAGLKTKVCCITRGDVKTGVTSIYLFPSGSFPLYSRI